METWSNIKLIFIVLLMCCLTFFLHSLIHLEGTSLRVSECVDNNRNAIELPIAFDVVKLCEKICDRRNNSCFTPDSLILYYQHGNTEQMTFRQRFQPYVRMTNVSSIMSDDFQDKLHKRKLCSLDDIDPAFGTLSKGNSCAIIGNGGIILESKCGREIDANDIVLRANFAHIQGYERDVGRKTSIMMINDEILRNLYTALIVKKGRDKSHREMLQYITQNLNESTLWFAKGTEAHGSAAKLQQLATFFSKTGLRPQLAYSMMPVDAAVSRRWKNFKYYPSSGFDILAVAQSLCQNISLYGFYPYDIDPRGRKVLHHYYEPNLTDFKTKVHNFNKEHETLKAMHKQGLIRLVYDPCET